ncbi:hypothetical protein ES703_112694 [subsurface metagenome]
MNSTPSDHFAPSSRCMVRVLPSSDHSQLVAKFGTGSIGFFSIHIWAGSTRPSQTSTSVPHQPDVNPAAQFQPAVGDPQKTLHLSPYTPTPSVIALEFITWGFLGNLSHTGGSSPLATANSNASGSI